VKEHYWIMKRGCENIKGRNNDYENMIKNYIGGQII
jgi:hypothetical protein